LPYAVISIPFGEKQYLNIAKNRVTIMNIAKIKYSPKEKYTTAQGKALCERTD